MTTNLYALAVVAISANLFPAGVGLIGLVLLVILRLLQGLSMGGRTFKAEPGLQMEGRL